MNWYIGQELFAIKTDTNQAGVVVGGEYVIKGLREPACKCHTLLIDVGIPFIANEGADKDFATCSSCGKRDILMYGKRWYSKKYFATIEQNISELTEILEHTKPFEIIVKNHP